MLRGAADVPDANPTRGPGLEIGRGLKKNDLGSWRGEGGAIKIKDTIELGVSWQAQIDAWRADQVEDKCRLGEESVPQTERKIWVAAAEVCYQMIFECLNGALSSVSKMNIGWGDLEGDTFLFQEGFYSCRALIFQGFKNLEGRKAKY